MLTTWYVKYVNIYVIFRTKVRLKVSMYRIMKIFYNENFKINGFFQNENEGKF